MPAPPPQACYRHPDRPAGVICQRCDRPICPSCMHQASVGFHCPECAKQGSQKVYSGFGAIATKPVLTQVIIGINLAVFLLSLVVDGASALRGDTGQLQIDLGLIARALAPTSNGLGVHVIGVGEGEWYRLVDLDGDGDMDLLGELRHSYVRAWRNDGTRTAPRLVAIGDTLRDATGAPIFADRQNILNLTDIDCNGPMTRAIDDIVDHLHAGRKVALRCWCAAARVPR